MSKSPESLVTQTRFHMEWKWTRKKKKKKRLKTTYSPPLDLKPQLEFDEESAQALMEKPCRSFLTTSAAKFFPFLLVSPLLTLSYEPLLAVSPPLSARHCPQPRMVVYL